jgi:hypothetical protein
MIASTAPIRPLPRRSAAALAATLLIGSCGGSGPAPVQPNPILVSVSSISPSSGPTVGGTPVVVTGANFVSGATLSIGQIPAQNVTVVDSTTIMATTAPGISGPADVLVVSGGQRAVLPQGFTYSEAPNAPPVITSITAQGTRPNEPAAFADLDETINVVARVSDVETPLDQLSYEWSAEIGTFAGTGTSVTWTAPHDAPKVPGSYTLTLTVTERYKGSDGAGGVVDRENKVTRTIGVNVHRSTQEITGVVSQFLNDFANSSVPPDVAVRNFSTALCPDGRANEFEDITANRALYSSITATYGPANVTVNFGSICTPDWRPRPGDACIALSCHWVSKFKTGGTDTTDGICFLSEVYEAASDRWKLCWSDFRGHQQTSSFRLRF